MIVVGLEKKYGSMIFRRARTSHPTNETHAKAPAPNGRTPADASLCDFVVIDDCDGFKLGHRKDLLAFGDAGLVIEQVEKLPLQIRE